MLFWCCLIAFFCGAGLVCLYDKWWYKHFSKEAGTPSASHDSAMLEIASVVKELAIDIENDGTVQADYYCQKLNAVVAQLQQ